MAVTEGGEADNAAAEEDDLKNRRGLGMSASCFCLGISGSGLPG